MNESDEYAVSSEIEISNFLMQYKNLVDNNDKGGPNVSNLMANQLAENTILTSVNFRRMEESFEKMNDADKTVVVLYLGGWNPNHLPDKGEIEKKNLGDHKKNRKMKKNDLIQAVVCRLCLDYNLVMKMKDGEEAAFPMPSNEEWGLLFKLESGDKESTLKSRRITLAWCVMAMLRMVDLGHLMKWTKESIFQFSSNLGGYRPPRLQKEDCRFQLNGDAKTPFPDTHEINSRLCIAINKGILARLSSGSKKKKIRFITNDSLLWLSGHAVEEKEDTCPKFPIFKPSEVDDTGNPLVLLTLPIPKRNLKEKAFVLKGGGKDQYPDHTIDPVSVFNNQADFESYSNEVTNKRFDSSLRRIFEKRQSQVLSESDFSREPNIVSPIILPLQHTALEPEKEQSTRAWCLGNIFSEKFHGEILEYLDEVPFLGSSREVGANGSTSKRYYRCAQEGGGYFQMSSDDTLLGCDELHPMEKKLAAFVSELAKEQDDIVHENVPEGKYQYKWRSENVMCQVTAGSIDGSRYHDHNDCGFHHNHELDLLSEFSSEGERALFENLPHRRLMRVWTFVFSNREGPNGALGFSEDRGGLDLRPVRERLVTDHCTLHIQSFGIQSGYKHMVYENGNTGPSPLDSSGLAGRFVISIRESLSMDDMQTVHHAARISNINPESLQNPRIDYSITNIVKAITLQSEPVKVRCKEPSISQGGLKKTAKENILDEYGMEIERWILENDLMEDDIKMETKKMKIDRTNPPYMTTMGWVEDSMTILDRLLSSFFVKKLYELGIHLWIKFSDDETSPYMESSLPVPKNQKRGKEKKGKKGAATDIYSQYGFIPKTKIIQNWKEINATMCLDQRSGLKYTHKHCRPGDVMDADDIRTIFNLPENASKGELWNHRHSALTNCVVLRHHYKNDTELENIQNELDSGLFSTSSFWIGGSGGSAHEVGSRPMNLVRAFNDRPPPVAVGNNHMNVDNPLNRCMLDCVNRRQVVFVFAPPLRPPAHNDKSIDLKDKQERILIRHSDYLQFIGLFEVSSHTYGKDTKEELRQVLSKACAKHGTNMKEEFWNHSYRVANHFKFFLTPMEIDWDVVCRDDIVHKKIIMDLSSKVAKEHLYYSVDTSKSMMDQIVGTESFIIEEKLWEMFQKKYLKQVDQGESVLNEDIEEEEEDSEDDVPYYDIDDSLFEEKSQKQNGDVITTLEKDKSSTMGRGTNNGDVIVNNDTKDIMIEQTLHRGLQFELEELISMVSRLSAAGAARALGHSYDKDKGAYTFLNRNEDCELEQKIGEVIQAVPFPMPIRTYDVGTSFFIELTLNTENQFRRPPNCLHNEYCYIRRIVRGQVSEKIMGDLLLTSLLNRCTGRVEQLRKYLTVNRRGVNGTGWKRLFDEKDVEDLPMFLRATQYLSGKKRKPGKATGGSPNVMTKMLSEQFRHSIPNAVKASVDSFASFIKKANKELRSNIAPVFTSDDALERKSAVFAMKKLLRVASNTKECNRSLEFVAAQVVCDLEELFCGDHQSNGASDCTFKGDYRVLGYGGTEGFTVCSNILRENAKPPSGPNVSQKRWDAYMKTIGKVAQKVRQKLNETSISELLSMGIEKVAVASEDDQIEMSLYVIANFREVSDNDIEHILCKIYLLLHRYRGTRAYSSPNPLRAHCYPVGFDDIFGYNGYIFGIMMTSFKIASSVGKTRQLKHPFVLSFNN